MQSGNETFTRQHALAQFAQLGYTLIDGSQEELGPCGATGRKNRGDVVLLPRLRHALRTLNEERPGVPIAPDLVEKAIDALTSGLSLVDIARANKSVYALLKDGIKIDARGQVINNEDDLTEQESDGQRKGAKKAKKIDNVPKSERNPTHRTLDIINWREPAKNDFTLVSRLWVDGKLGKRCLDLVGFVNGLPLLLLEIDDTDLVNIYQRINDDYKINVPSLFWYNAFIVVARSFNDCKMGSMTTPWEHFFQWKRVSDESEAESSRLDTLLAGICEQKRLLDIVENFTLFDEANGLHKLVARNHQYLGVNNAVASLRAWEQERAAHRLAGTSGVGQQHGKLGVFWHTQGSGKSYSMVFFVRKIQRIVGSQYTFVVVTDREDLDKQIYDNFNHTGTIKEDADEVHVHSARHLKQLLSETHLLLFTLIQKFYSEQPGQDYEEISDNENIIIMADEAHRTQYDTLAKNMRTALPRASFIGFTGTPLMDGEEQTRATFGSYVSIYNFRRAINDGVTVPLYYENHTPQLGNINSEFHEDMAELLEVAHLDERQEQRIIEQYARQGNLFMKSERLDQVAADIVRHFMKRGYQGKAMVVSIDKIASVRTYNRVQEQWKQYRESLEARLATETDPDTHSELAQTIDYMNGTKMAVVVSESEGDVKRFATFSEESGELVEIAPHQRFKSSDLAADFKKADHSFRIAFVCAMWITGFDVPCLSTIYLDRPLKGHTLMQTIARANRVYEDKTNGLIVDSASNLSAITKALAIYAREDASTAGDRPIGAKSELVQILRERLEEAERFCQQLDIDVQALQAKLQNEADKEKREGMVRDTVNLMVQNDQVKLRALLLTTEVSKYYRAILPDASEPEFTPLVHLYTLLKDGIYSTMRVTGIKEILGKTTRLVHDSLEVYEREARRSADTGQPRGAFDLRDIDLDALKDTLRTGNRYIKAEEMRQLLYERIKRMIEVNPSRVHYMEKLQRAISRYNEGSANLATDPQLLDARANIRPLRKNEQEQQQALDEYNESLAELYTETRQEDQRHIQEGLSQEELTIFDLLLDRLELTEAERDRVKQTARHLLAELRPTFDAIDWQKKPTLLSRVEILISDLVNTLPDPPYSQEQCERKSEELFLYIRERYKNDGSISAA